MSFQDEEGYTIRQAREEDRYHVAALVIKNHLALSDQVDQEYVCQVKDLQTDFGFLLDPEPFSRGFCLVATTPDGMIVGSAGMEEPRLTSHGMSSVLNAVTVHPHHRRKGLARKLVTQVLDEARRRGVSRLTLVTLLELMRPAWTLYEQLGFKRIDEEIVKTAPRKMTVLTYELVLNQS